MAPDQKTLSIKPATWGAEASAWIANACQRDLLDVQLQVASGASLYTIHSGEACVGAFVLRVDRYPTGDEGVIVAASAALDGVDMTASVLPVIEGLFHNVQRIRYHTKNPALARKMAAYGYKAAEIVSIKELQNGR